MGAIIRILLISNVEGETDELVGSLEFEGATVVSKDVSGNAKSLAKSIATLFADGKYDFVIAVSDNTVGTNVALNKYEGITASICHDPEEAKSAREEGVNVAVVRQGNIGQVDAIVSAFSKGNGLQLKIKMPTIQKLQPRQNVEEEPAAHERESPVAMQKKPQPKQVAQVRREREEPEPPKRPGLYGWIKDSLGIIDVEKPKPSKKKQDDSKGS